MEKELLQRIGLTTGEIKVYLALLDVGETTTGPLIKKSKIAGSKIYEVLDRLIEKGLVSHILKNGIKHFSPSNPERLIDYLEEKEKLLSDQKEEIKDIIPQFKRKLSESENGRDAAIFEGFRGMETVFNDALSSMNRGDTIYVTNVFKIRQEEDIFFKHWNERRAKKGVRLKMILDKQAKGQFQSNTKTNPLSELKWMPENLPAPTPINIYKDRVILFVRNDDGKPLLVVIWGKSVVDSFRIQFDLQWRLAKK